MLVIFLVSIYRYENPKHTAIFPISVVIAARNEYNYLQQLIPILFQQDYKNYEVIIVNDRSYDNTKALLRYWQSKYPDLKVVHIENTPADWDGKKWAVYSGILSTQHEHIVLTDADCLPRSFSWLSCLAQHCGADTHWVLGYSPYVNYKKNLLSYFTYYETLWTAIYYMSLAHCGIPYMAVGRNLLYRKSTFLKHGGFSDFCHSCGGDDDIVVNRYAKGGQVAIALKSDSQTITFPLKNFALWIKQKRRHLGASHYYLSYKKYLIGLLSLSHWAVYLLFFLVWQRDWWQTILLLLSVRYILTSIIIYIFTKKTKLYNDFWWRMFFLEPLFFAYQLVQATLLTLGKKNNEWK